MDHVTHEVQARGAASKPGQRQPQTTTKSSPRASVLAPAEAQAEPLAAAQPGAVPVPRLEEAASTAATVTAATGDEPADPVQVAVIRPVERSDRAEYERVLAYFKEGNLDGSRDGFSAFLAQYPNSDLAPNARYWLGESHYGKREYKQAIDSYDRV